MLCVFGLVTVLVSSSKSGKSKYLSPGESPSLSRSSFSSSSANSYSFYYFFFYFLLTFFYLFDFVSVFWTRPYGSSWTSPSLSRSSSLALASVVFFTWVAACFPSFVLFQLRISIQLQKIPWAS
jgi:hypothetical protein